VPHERGVAAGRRDRLPGRGGEEQSGPTRGIAPAGVPRRPPHSGVRPRGGGGPPGDVGQTGGVFQERGMNSTDWFELLGVFVLIAVVGVMAGSETAITRMSRARAYKLVEEKRRGAQSLRRIVENVPPYLNVVLWVTLLATTGGTTLATILAARHLGSWS